MACILGDTKKIITKITKIAKFVNHEHLEHEGDRVSGLTKPGEVGDFFALVSMKSPNFCQKAKF